MIESWIQGMRGSCQVCNGPVNLDARGICCDLGLDLQMLCVADSSAHPCVADVHV